MHSGELSGSDGNPPEADGLCAGPHERTLRESGNRRFLDAEATGESIRAIVLPRDRCLSYKKETYG